VRQEVQQRHLLQRAEGVEGDSLHRVQDPPPEADARVRPGDLGRLLPDLVGKILERVPEVPHISVQRWPPPSQPVAVQLRALAASPAGAVMASAGVVTRAG
jgi:hypothetical protein